MAESDGKYLVFAIAEGNYGIPITKVREVIRHEAITAVHEASTYLKGVINLRGKIIPIVDMRSKFGLEPREYDDRTVFVIVDVGRERESFSFGMVVDTVRDVVSLAAGDIEKTPDVGLRLKSGYLLGIAKSAGAMLMILDIDKVLNSDEILDLQAVAADGGE